MTSLSINFVFKANKECKLPYAPHEIQWLLKTGLEFQKGLELT